METINRLEPYVFSILRIMVGLLFMQHGLVKLFGFPTGAGFPAFLSLTWFEGVIEMIGGGLIVIGLFTRSAAFITSGEMAIGYFMVTMQPLAAEVCCRFFWSVIPSRKTLSGARQRGNY